MNSSLGLSYALHQITSIVFVIYSSYNYLYSLIVMKTFYANFTINVLVLILMSYSADKYALLLLLLL